MHHLWYLGSSIEVGSISAILQKDLGESISALLQSLYSKGSSLVKIGEMVKLPVTRFVGLENLVARFLTRWNC